MTEEKKPKTVDIELTGPHTHGGKPYEKGAVLRVRDDQFERLQGQQKAKAAKSNATPLNVDDEGKLIR